MPTRATTRSTASKKLLLIGEAGIIPTPTGTVLSPNVQRIIAKTRDSLIKTRREYMQRDTQNNNNYMNHNNDVITENTSRVVVMEDDEDLFAHLEEEKESPIDDEGVFTPPSKAQEDRFELITTALKDWDAKSDAKTLFKPETWEKLITDTVRGTRDARKYKNPEKLKNFSRAVVEQIASKAYQRKVANLLYGNGNNGSGGDLKNSRVMKNFLELCQNHEEEMRKKVWNKSQGNVEEEVEEEEDNSPVKVNDKSFWETSRRSSEGGFVTDDSPVRDGRVLDAAEFAKLSDLEGDDEDDDDDFREGKENSFRNRSLEKGKTVPKAQKRKIKSSKSKSRTPVKLKNVEKTKSKKEPKTIFTYTRPRLNSQNCNNPASGSEKTLPTPKNPIISSSSSSPSPRTVDDEIIENPTPPATPLSDTSNDGPSPEKKSRKSSDDEVATQVLEKRRTLRRCGNSTVVGNTGRIDRQALGYDYIQAIEAIGSQTQDLDDFKSPRDPLEQDKENLPKSPGEIARSYPRPPSCPELTPEMFQDLKECLAKPPQEIIVEKGGLKIKREQLSIYDQPEWLEDNHIDFYLELIKERNLKRNYPKVYTFRCFFYHLLEKSGLETVKLTTDNKNIFEYDLVIFPIHSNHHWVLIVMDNRKKTLTCYDSMDHNNTKHINCIKQYVLSEWNKLKGPRTRRTKTELSQSRRWKTLFDDSKSAEIIWEESGWSVQDLGADDNIPQQKNGRDCGIFLLQFAEYLSRNKTFDFEQKHIAYFRKRMMYETLKQYLLID